MSFDIYLYDSLMAPLNSNFIEIIETDDWGVKIDRQMSCHLGNSEFGAKLKSPSPAQPITIWIHDTAKALATTTLGHLNGKLSARLDVSLYGLPGGPGSGPATSSGANFSSDPQLVVDLISRRVAEKTWTETEGIAVRTLFNTVTQAVVTPRLDAAL